MSTQRFLINGNDGIVYVAGGLPLGIPIQGPSPRVPNTFTDWPRATCTFSGVTLRTVCCVATVSAKVNSEATPTNGAHCLGITGVHVNDGFSLAETNGITLGVSTGCASPFTRDPVTVLSYDGCVWRLRRYVLEGVTSRTYYIFDASSTEKCFPMTFTNTLVACADDGVPVPGLFNRGPNLGSGGTATVEFACCGVNNPLAAFNPATESNVSDVRDCCEVFEVTIGGGTVYDGFWRLAKSQAYQTGNTVRWSASKYDFRFVSISKTAGRWFLQGTGHLSGCIISWRGAVSTGCPDTTWDSLFTSGACGGTPTLSVVRRNCWDGSHL